jgi:HSP20 family molecular chaperone IbpA
MSRPPVSDPPHNSALVSTSAAPKLEGDADALRARRPSGSFPALRLSETKEHVIVSAVVPGFAESDLEITLAKDVLCIVGHHRAELPGGFSVLRRGRRSMDFRSEIKLLNEVAWNDTEAHLELGVLTIRLRKDAPSSRPLVPIRST